jgi:hypothetical protein
MCTYRRLVTVESAIEAGAGCGGEWTSMAPASMRSARVAEGDIVIVLKESCSTRDEKNRAGRAN